MKKLFAVLLAAMLALCSTASLADGAPAAIGGMTGGWAVNEEVAAGVPEDVAGYLNAALEGFVGSNIEPVALLATQLVAGTNYCLLCKITPVVPNPVTSLSLVYVYVDLQGQASLLEISGLEGFEQPEAALAGAWAVYEGAGDPLPEEAQAAFDKATETLLGANYEPVTLLGTQIVAGTNYDILCKTTPVVPNAVSTITRVTVYADLEGNASVTEVKDMAFGISEEEGE